MSSLAAAKADNFYYPPDFDPQKHETLNKYNGQHPLRERASKLDQGILVIRFEIPFNIWCEKCGEHIAKGERFNAEKKAIGQYHSTKILQFTMTHHCGCKITIQTDPKRAEYLVVEGARKKEESYNAADAEVIELPDEAEKEKRARDPLYRLEYQQDAKAKALTGAERLAAIHDVVDARTADPYSLNRAMRAALRGEKRAAAARDARRAELGLPETVDLLAPSAGDTIASQVAFLTSSERATAGAEARRKRILEEDIFASGGALGASGGALGAAHGNGGLDMPAPYAANRPALKRSSLSTTTLTNACSAASEPAPPSDLQVRNVQDINARTAIKQQQQQQAQGRSHHFPRTCQAAEAIQPVVGHSASISSAAANTGTEATLVPPTSKGMVDASPSSATLTTAPSGRPPPGAAALALAAARAAARPEASRSTMNGLPLARPGLAGAAALKGSVGAHGSGRRLGSASGADPGLLKRSNKDRAAELHKRRLGGVGFTPSKSEV